MKTEKIFKEMKDIIQDIETIAQDKNTSISLSAWMSGYMERAKLESQLKERTKRNGKGGSCSDKAGFN